jgi:imidazolonepropionase-like amidohydrolase
MHASRKLLVVSCFGIACALLVGTLVLAGGRAPAPSKTIALIGGRVVTQTDAGTIEASVLIRDGKIVAVGRDIAIPAEATKIDVTGLTITPGLIDARGSLWLSSATGQDSPSDASLEILDEVDPTREDWKEVARQGVTAVYVQPAHGLLGGRGAVLRVGPAETVEDVIIKASAAAQASLGAAPPAPVAVDAPAGGRGRGGRGRGQQAAPVQQAAPPPTSNSLTRYAQYEQLKRTLEAAKKYDDDFTKSEKADAAKASKAAADAKTAANKQGGDKKAAAAKTASSGTRLKHDPAKDFLRKVVSGQIPLRLEAHREDDVANALRLAKELKLHLVLEGVSNPRGAGEAIVSGRIPLVLGPFADLEEVSTNRIDRPNDWPKALLAGDGRFAIGTYSTQPMGSRLLRVHAAHAVAMGIDADKVLRAITRDAAEILGVADRSGTIEVGKDADLVAFAGDPLDPSVPVRITISAGKITYDAPAVSGGLGDKTVDEYVRKDDAIRVFMNEIGRAKEYMAKLRIIATAPESLPEYKEYQSIIDELNQKIAQRKAEIRRTIHHRLEEAMVVSKPIVSTVSEAKHSKTTLPLPAVLPKKYALKTSRLLNDSGEFAPGIVVVENGKISSVGTNAPEGVQTFDLGSAVVSPGLVASYNDLGLRASVDDNAEANAAYIRTADVLDPHYRPLRELIDGGYTSSLFVPGSINVVAGAPCGVRLGATEPFIGDVGQCFVLAASAREASRAGGASEDALPPIGGRRGRGAAAAPRYPGSLGGQIQLIEQVLSGKAPSTELYVPKGVRLQIENARQHSVKPLLERKGIAFFEAHTRTEIAAALQLIERFKLRGVLVNPVEIRPYLDEIKRLGVGIIATSVHPGSYDRPLLELVDASLAGIPVSFGSGSAQEMRTTAALAINAGMPREVAWRGLTTTAAQSAGLPEGYGRLVPGGSADLAIWDGSPLDLRSRPLRVLIDGKAAFAADED